MILFFHAAGFELLPVCQRKMGWILSILIYATDIIMELKCELQNAYNSTMVHGAKVVLEFCYPVLA